MEKKEKNKLIENFKKNKKLYLTVISVVVLILLIITTIILLKSNKSTKELSSIDYIVNDINKVALQPYTMCYFDKTTSNVISKYIGSAVIKVNKDNTYSVYIKDNNNSVIMATSNYYMLDKSKRKNWNKDKRNVLENAYNDIEYIPSGDIIYTKYSRCIQMKKISK